jgi:hypothetical protein
LKHRKATGKNWILIIKMEKIISKISNPKILITLFALFIVFNTLIFPQFSPEYKGQSLHVLDLRFAYNKAEVMNLFTKLGDEGRKTYMIIELTADLIYPIIYTLLLVGLLFRFSKDSVFENIMYFPFLILFFDYLENFNIVYMLNSYPEISSLHVDIGAFFTKLKWIMVFLSVLFVFVLFGTQQYFRNKQKS